MISIKCTYRMTSIFEVESASGITTIKDELGCNQDVRYLTLRNRNKGADARYYVSLMGKDADIEWQEGDLIMLELSFCAYKTHNHWHMSNRRDSISFIESQIKKKVNGK